MTRTAQQQADVAELRVAVLHGFDLVDAGAWDELVVWWGTRETLLRGLDADPAADARKFAHDAHMQLLVGHMQRSVTDYPRSLGLLADELARVVAQPVFTGFDFLAVGISAAAADVANDNYGNVLSGVMEAIEVQWGGASAFAGYARRPPEEVAATCELARRRLRELGS